MIQGLKEGLRLLIMTTKISGLKSGPKLGIFCLGWGSGTRVWYFLGWLYFSLGLLDSSTFPDVFT